MQKHDAAWVLKILDYVFDEFDDFHLAGLHFVVNVSVHLLG